MFKRHSAARTLLSALFLFSAASCTKDSSPVITWNPPQRLVETRAYNPGQYSVSNASGEHAALISATISDGWQLGVQELDSTSWTPLPSLPFPDPTKLFFPRVLVDTRGDLVLIVTQVGTDEKVEHQIVRRKSGSFGAVSGLHPPFPINLEPNLPSRYRQHVSTAVAMDDQGRGLIVWSQPIDLSTVEIWAVLFADIVGTPISLRKYSSPTLPALHITTNRDGTRFVAWNEPDSYLITKWDGAAWSPAKPLAVDKVAEFSRDFTLHSTEGLQASLFTYSNTDLRVRAYTWNGELVTNVQDLDTLSGPLGAMTPDGVTLRTAMADDGSIAAAWNRSEGGHHTRLYTDGKWSDSATWQGSLEDVYVASKDHAAVLLSEYIPQERSQIHVQEFSQGSWQPRQTLSAGYYPRSMRLSTNRQGAWLAFWWQAETPSLAHPMSLWGAVGLPR